MNKPALPRLGAACGAIFAIVLTIAAGDGSQSFSAARAVAAGPVMALLVKAAELHVRADLEVVDAAEHDLSPDALAALRVPAAPDAPLQVRSNPAWPGASGYR